MRLNTDSGKSYGFLFGKVLPGDDGPSEKNIYFSVVRSKGNGETMESFDYFPN